MKSFYQFIHEDKKIFILGRFNPNSDLVEEESYDPKKNMGFVLASSVPEAKEKAIELINYKNKNMENWQNLRQSDWRTLERFISLKLYQNYDCEQVEEGVLGLGIIHLIGYKHTYIIKERALNCWSSTHTIEKINH